MNGEYRLLPIILCIAIEVRADEMERKKGGSGLYAGT